jgi:hypothetical protein
MMCHVAMCRFVMCRVAMWRVALMCPLAFALVFIGGLAAPAFAQDPTKNVKVTWKKTVVDKIFRSEGVGVADVNKDGKADIITGDVWYEAPAWKMHVLSEARKFDIKGWNPLNYSESFGVFTDDFNGDGWVDAIVIPFPGKECYWYENPGSKGGSWKQHELTNSSCNETPIFIDLFGKGRKTLVMGWQPPGKSNEGELCYFLPGKEPTQPWQRVSISGPSIPKKHEQPGTQRFSHGLGHGDVNGDGRIDILVPQGWWEHPAKIDGAPWKFHPANLGPACADMHVYDVDGDGKNDVISSSAHNYGFWWFQQKPGKEHPAFVQNELFADPLKAAKLDKENDLSAGELALYNAINKWRGEQKRAPWKLNRALTLQARGAANALEAPEKAKATYQGQVVWAKHVRGDQVQADALAGQLLPDADKERRLAAPRLEVGVAVAKDKEGKTVSAIMIGDNGQFSLPSQTHALHFLDINGDGLKDLVTGRRWWAHGPKGDAGPNDPAYVYWFEAKKNKDGYTTFVPHEVDDDSGIGTAFAVEDINGDGIPDIIVSNKRGVYVLVQVRTPVVATPPRNE